MNDNKIIIGVILATVVLLFGAIWFAQKSNSSADVKVVTSQDVRAVVGENTYDWGTIQLKGGDVKKVFAINNTGTDSLQLYDVLTSCTCTSARVIIDGQSSPSFGMHQKSNWVGEIPAGGEAEIEVTFVPDFHGPSGIGAITRQVKVATNDPNNPELLFNLTANVVN